MIKYIDCDGVILDSENGLFDEYYRLKEKDPNLRKTTYLQSLDWNYWLQHRKILANAVELLKRYETKDNCILSKVHSLEEAKAKIEFFRGKQVMNDFIIVPNELSKSQIVVAKRNILVDDNVNNLEDWNRAGGIPIYFGKEECEFYRINSLEDILDNRRLLEILSRIRKDEEIER